MSMNVILELTLATRTPHAITLMEVMIVTVCMVLLGMASIVQVKLYALCSSSILFMYLRVTRLIISMYGCLVWNIYLNSPAPSDIGHNSYIQ